MHKSLFTHKTNSQIKTEDIMKPASQIRNLKGAKQNILTTSTSIIMILSGSVEDP